MSAGTHNVWIALGSNLGDPAANVRQAIEQLRALSATPLLVSSLWETTPVDCPPGSPKFINATIGLLSLPGETSESLLKKLQLLEKEFGRQVKKILNEARPLDLDLIAFNQEVRQTPTLTLPHPRAHERRFVLEPLNEIAPGVILPGQPHTVAELLQKLPPDAQMKKLGRALTGSFRLGRGFWRVKEQRQNQG